MINGTLKCYRDNSVDFGMKNTQKKLQDKVLDMYIGEKCMLVTAPLTTVKCNTFLIPRCYSCIKTNA